MLPLPPPLPGVGVAPPDWLSLDLCQDAAASLSCGHVPSLPKPQVKRRPREEAAGVGRRIAEVGLSFPWGHSGLGLRPVHVAVPVLAVLH